MKPTLINKNEFNYLEFTCPGCGVGWIGASGRGWMGVKAGATNGYLNDPLIPLIPLIPLTLAGPVRGPGPGPGPPPGPGPWPPWKPLGSLSGWAPPPGADDVTVDAATATEAVTDDVTDDVTAACDVTAAAAALGDWNGDCWNCDWNDGSLGLAPCGGGGGWCWCWCWCWWCRAVAVANMSLKGGMPPPGVGVIMRPSSSSVGALPEWSPPFSPNSPTIIRFYSIQFITHDFEQQKLKFLAFLIELSSFNQVDCNWFQREN